MNSDSITKARQFVATVELPGPPPISFEVAKAPRFAFDAARDQATVVGSDVVSFVKGVPPEQRSDITNASLLAQLVAKRIVAEPKTLKEVTAWYDEYFEVLSRIGFVIRDKGFAEYE